MTHNEKPSRMRKDASSFIPDLLLLKIREDLELYIYNDLIKPNASTDYN